AVLLAVNASEFFTQDIEDFIIQPTVDLTPLRNILKSARELLTALGGQPAKLTRVQAHAMKPHELVEEILSTHHAIQNVGCKV
ncbi:MAG: hypothetical protein ACRDIB_02350, partial [Ardenticatenaceae bacterium]